MIYVEHDNLIFRGETNPVTKSPWMTEALVNGQWKPVSSQTLLDAGFYGTPMSEGEARQFQGEGWPEETAPALAP